jgi:hypothetical protein
MNRELHKEIVVARSTISNAEKQLQDILTKLLLNIEYEKAGEEAPYNYQELHAEAQALRDEKKNAPEALTDNAAVFVADMFPGLRNDGSLIAAGTRINYKGKLYKATVGIWDSEMYYPEQSPQLWEEVKYQNGIRTIPEVITTTSAFAKGELGYWKGAVYESLIDNNVWNPDAYPSGWKLT